MIKKNKLLSILILTVLLNSCSNNSLNKSIDNNEVSNKKIEIWKNNEKITNNQGNNIKQSNWNKNLAKILKISEKCIWCWKCTMIDPDHFKINTNTFIPDIISQKNINSNETQSAISNCPVNAISIS